MSNKYDVAIVGGGIVGLLTSLALSNAGYKTIHIERNSLEVTNDNRSIAVSYSSIAFLNTLGLWDNIANLVQPIQNVHISDKGMYGRAMIHAKDDNLPFLGAISPMKDLLKMALTAVENDKNITKTFSTNVVGINDGEDGHILSVEHTDTKIHGTVAAKLIIACDGVNSSIRKMLNVSANTTDYNQDAVVFDIQTELSHDDTAYERFMSDGVLAVLPKDDNIMGCVWTVDRDISKNKLNMSPQEFESAVQERFGYKLGQIKVISKPAVFPLYLVQSDEMFQDNVLFFGNALHFLHPVSGQGMNLSIRDIGCLYDLLNGGELSAGYLKSQLSEFENIRKPDHDRTIAVTHGFVKWFVSEGFTKTVSRGLGIHILQRSKFAKKTLSRVMMGKLSKGSTLMRKVIE